MEDNKYKTWCITINETQDSPLPSTLELENFFIQFCELYVFQLEKGEAAERNHFQCAIKLKLRKRKSTLINSIKVASFKEFQWQLTPMYGTWDEAYAYCTKSDTKLSLPITNTLTYEGNDVSFLTKLDQRYPWQEFLFKELFNEHISRLKVPDDRKIYWFHDPHGNSGKSKFTKWMVLSNSSITKVPFGTATQLRAAIIAAGKMKCYVVDIPRTLGRDDDLNSIISVLEDLKNGFVVSSMYGKNAQLLMDPPHVIVFSNLMCPVSKMSGDRWIHVHINIDKNYKVMESATDAYSFSNH